MLSRMPDVSNGEHILFPSQQQDQSCWLLIQDSRENSTKRPSFVPGKMSMLVLECRGVPSLSQVRLGGGKAVASHVKEKKLFITTVMFSVLKPTILGGTVQQSEAQF